MKPQSILPALCTAILALPAIADTFVLNDGTRLEGTILRQEADSYVLEVQVTKSIKDERIVAKADVREHLREKPESKAFEAIAKLVPTPDSLTSSEYDKRIIAVNNFIKNHKATSKAKDAEAILATLKKEAAVVSAGGFKAGGSLVSAEEYKANALEIDAKAMESKIREAAARSEFVTTMRLFDQFVTDFRYTGSFVSVLPVVRQTVQTYNTQATAALTSLPARMKERKAGLERMTGDSKGVTERALQEEDAAADALYQEDKAAREKWVRAGAFNKQSLEEAVKTTEAELRRIDKAKPQGDKDHGKTYRTTWTAIHSGEDAKAVKAAVAAAAETDMPARYLAKLEEAAAAVAPAEEN